jgi:hypothetical protein
LAELGRGYRWDVEAVVTIESVRTSETQGGNVRYSVHDTDGKEYTTFREAIGGSQTGPDREAWRTAVEAAPWLVGESDPHAKTSSEELYETLKPFKDKVAEDIRHSDSGRE